MIVRAVTHYPVTEIQNIHRGIQQFLLSGKAATCLLLLLLYDVIMLNTFYAQQKYDAHIVILKYYFRVLKMHIS